MSRIPKAGMKFSNTLLRSRGFGLPTPVWLGALLVGVGLVVGQSGELLQREVSPVVQHAPAQTLILPKAARVEATGASATLLPSGQWLLLGGRSLDGEKSITAARLYEPDRHRVTPLERGLRHARAYHTATLLADGWVLVLGGIEREESLVHPGEIFDPTSGTVEAAPARGLLARARHRATLLTDGRVLITGGVGEQGWAIDQAQIVDIEKGQVQNARLDKARSNHLSALLPDHSVLVWGGVGDEGVPIGEAEIYDPAIQQFLPYDPEAAARALAKLKDTAAPTLIDSHPLRWCPSDRWAGAALLALFKALEGQKLEPQDLSLGRPGRPRFRDPHAR